ncbi:Hypothetical_protein [Hexamita inflata]|uniref:Hypothetical_protein n=1 Tax=Hexamita inflata TaxID=28002 RepID=A0AA86Q6D4_9EUKA|nr:Hypothetical protein HINF_LOCUS34552 [Hexamita inflata]
MKRVFQFKSEMRQRGQYDENKPVPKMQIGLSIVSKNGYMAFKSKYEVQIFLNQLQALAQKTILSTSNDLEKVRKGRNENRIPAQPLMPQVSALLIGENKLIFKQIRTCFHSLQYMKKSVQQSEKIKQFILELLRMLYIVRTRRIDDCRTRKSQFPTFVI